MIRVIHWVDDTFPRGRRIKNSIFITILADWGRQANGSTFEVLKHDKDIRGVRCFVYNLQIWIDADEPQLHKLDAAYQKELFETAQLEMKLWEEGKE